jgi:hypothetical protein
MFLSDRKCTQKCTQIGFCDISDLAQKRKKRLCRSGFSQANGVRCRTPRHSGPRLLLIAAADPLAPLDPLHRHGHIGKTQTSHAVIGPACRRSLRSEKLPDDRPRHDHEHDIPFTYPRETSARLLWAALAWRQSHRRPTARRSRHGRQRKHVGALYPLMFVPAVLVVMITRHKPDHR